MHEKPGKPGFFFAHSRAGKHGRFGFEPRKHKVIEGPNARYSPEIAVHQHPKIIIKPVNRITKDRDIVKCPGKKHRQHRITRPGIDQPRHIQK